MRRGRLIELPEREALAWQEGQRAKHIGEELTDCPFPDDIHHRRKRIQWLRGFNGDPPARPEK